MLVDSQSVEVRDSSGRGKGVFAKKLIPNGKVVADYLGEVRDLNDDLPAYPGLYDMWVYRDLTICPDISRYGAHTLNHSCDPNCAMFPYKEHILIISIKDITPGEELTFHYWCSQDSETMVCSCGSKKCRGSWLVSDDECKKYCDWVEQQNTKYLASIKPGYRLKRLNNYKNISTIEARNFWSRYL